MTKIIFWFTAFIICLPTLLPLFQPTFFPLHDYTHVARLTEMHKALADGHFPVRWSKNLAWGYGLPEFNFYAPLPYYIAEVFHLIGFSPIWSIKILLILNALICFAFMYKASSLLYGRLAGLVSATAIIYAPYRAVDIYVRGAFGELTAITFITISLYCLLKLIKTNNIRWTVFASLALAGIVTSHNLTALISFPFLFSLIILAFIIKNNSQNIFKTSILWIAAFTLSIMLSSFYALPSFIEKNLTDAGTLTQGFSNYNHHFLYLRQLWQSKWAYGGSIFGLEDDISFEIGKIHLILAVISGFAFLFNLKKFKRLAYLSIPFFGILSLLAILMTTFKTKFIWDSLPFLSYIQFPWRFLTIIIIMLSFALGGSFLLLKKRLHRFIASVIIITALILLNSQYFKPREYLADNNILYYTDEARIKTEMSGVIPDFAPKTQTPKPLPVINNRFELTNATSDSLSVIINRTHEFYLIAKPQSESLLLVNILDYPTWRLYINGQSVSHLTDANGLINLSLHQYAGGEISISGVFTETPLRQTANAITLLGIIICAYILIHPALKEKRHDFA